jgi:copper(I)-binding protein
VSRVQDVTSVLALVGALGGCAQRAAPAAETPADGIDGGVGGIGVRNMFVLGPKPAMVLPPGRDAPLYLTLAGGATADRLIGVSAPGTAASAAIAGGGITVPAGRAVVIGPRPVIVLHDLRRPLHGGDYTWITLTFRTAGKVRLNTPVMPYDTYYTTYSPAP